MMLSHHTPADAKYAELLDIAETLTSIYQSSIISSAEIIVPHSTFPEIVRSSYIDCFSLNFADDSLTHWGFALATIFLPGFALHLLGSSRLSSRQDFSLRFLAIHFHKYTSVHCFTYSDLT